jgi:hypothetical protein
MFTPAAACRYPSPAHLRLVPPYPSRCKDVTIRVSNEKPGDSARRLFRFASRRSPVRSRLAPSPALNLARVCADERLWPRGWRSG